MENKPQITGVLPAVNEEFYDMLFNSTDQGFALLKKLSDQDGRPVDFQYVKVNRAFERHSGIQNVVDKTVREVIFKIDEQLMALIDSVNDTDQKIHFEEYIADLDTWFSGEVFPTSTNGTVAFLFNNITERKRIETALQESKDRKAFLLKLSDEVRNIADPVKVQEIASRLLGEHLAANQVHYGETVGEVVVIHQGWGNGLPPMVGTFRQQDFGKRLHEGYRAGITQFTDNIHTDLTITEAERKVIAGAGFNAYVAVPYLKNGQWVATLAVHSIAPRKWSQNEIAIVQETAERTWDAVERARVETSLRESEVRYKNEAARLRAILSNISDALYIGDLSGITFANQPALDQVGYTTFEELNQNIGVLIEEIQTRDAVSKKIIPFDKRVFARALAGEHAVQNVELRHWKSGDQRIVRCAASPVIVDGNIVAAVAINTDITDQWHLTAALEESEERFRTFVMAGSDFVFSVSPDWQRMEILKNELFRPAIAPDGSNWMLNYIPDESQEPLKELIRIAIGEGKMFDLEHEVIMADGQKCWMHCRALPVLDFRGEITEWRGAGSDITVRKKAELRLQNYNDQLQQEVSSRTAELQASKNLLQSVFDTSLMQMSILQAVRDQHGEIMDIEIMLVNKEHERVMGRSDLIGVHYVKEYPGMKKSVLFDLIIKTIETGEPHETEYYYPYEGFNSWYVSMFVKLNDGVVAVTMDISARKQAEEELLSNFVLLQQSEDLALLGSWDYNIANGRFKWSKGMYRLFNIGEGVEIQPEIYLQYATEASMAAAERVVSHIRNGDTEFEETLEIKVDGNIKLLRLKATIIKGIEEQSIRVLGVDWDITDIRKAEARIRKLEAEQQMEIFRVSLSTVEEERHRISESLHNGLGQLLYGIKINFSSLSQIMDVKTFEESKGYTNHLLTEAIKESRRISHELMPTILEDFGLKSAIEDICHQMQDGIKFPCTVRGINGRLEKYLELAVYRSVQELITNAVKHAHAAKVITEVIGYDQEIKVKVKDDGRGMEASKGTKPGIGLVSIRSKIKLLNGTMTIQSDGVNGTTVELTIPKPKK